MKLRIATAEGLVESASGVATKTPVRVFGDALIEGDCRLLWHGEAGWTLVGETPGLRCAVDAPGGLIVGTDGAHLRQLGGNGLELMHGFETMSGRSEWYTPWGGPPEVRSLACTADNVLLANVHVGGIARSADGGRTWNPTVDIALDVHQVRSIWGRGDLAVAAASVGLLVSTDAGQTWRVHAEGLHATYCRAVAVPDEAILISASDGPRGKKTAVYRTSIHADTPFQRVSDWMEHTVESHALDGFGGDAAFGTSAGEVYESADAGTTWSRTRVGLRPVTSVSLVA